MHANEKLINDLYTGFQAKNADQMAACYSDTAKFHDPVFEDLKGVAIGAMWKMLIERASDLKIEFSNVTADDQKGSADWVATYPFSKTGNIITNRIHAEFTFENGKIKTHKDSFSLWKWASMALGFKGTLMGWSGAVQNKIRQEAQNGLKLWMKRKKIG